MKKSKTNPYVSLDYINHARWESFWVQIEEILRTNPKNALEIGKGSGVVSFVLQNQGIDVTTLDVDKRVSPDVVGDVRQLPFRDKSFDTVLCCQVLEHLPFSDFEQSLKELRRVARDYVVISLPEPFSTYFYLATKFIPFIPKKSFVFKVIRFVRSKVDSVHKWEIGWPGTSLNQVDQAIKTCGFKIERTFCPAENLYHRFYILKKN